jgi:hypothetical protein
MCPALSEIVKSVGGAPPSDIFSDSCESFLTTKDMASDSPVVTHFNVLRTSESVNRSSLVVALDLAISSVHTPPAVVAVAV